MIIHQRMQLLRPVLHQTGSHSGRHLSGRSDNFHFISVRQQAIVRNRKFRALHSFGNRLLLISLQILYLHLLDIRNIRINPGDHCFSIDLLHTGSTDFISSFGRCSKFIVILAATEH